MILEYDDVIGENTLLSKPVYSAVTLYLLNFIVFTSDKPTDLNYKNIMSVILSSVRFNKVIKAIIAFMTFKITVI